MPINSMTALPYSKMNIDYKGMDVKFMLAILRRY